MPDTDRLAATLSALRAGKTTVNLTVRITSGGDAPASGRSGARPLSPKTRSALDGLRGRSAEVMAWLAADPERGAAYLADPAGTLRGSGLGLDERSLRALGTGRGLALPDNVTLGTVTVEVEGTQR